MGPQNKVQPPDAEQNRKFVRKPGLLKGQIEFLPGYETADAEIEAMFMESILADEPSGTAEY